MAIEKSVDVLSSDRCPFSSTLSSSAPYGVLDTSVTVVVAGTCSVVVVTSVVTSVVPSVVPSVGVTGCVTGVGSLFGCEPLVGYGDLSPVVNRNDAGCVR